MSSFTRCYKSVQDVQNDLPLILQHHFFRQIHTCYKIKNLTFEGIKNHHFLRSNVHVDSIEILFGVDSVEIFCWSLILKHECLQVLQAPSKVPSTCLSFCSYKPLQSPKAKRLLFDFAAFFSYVLYKIKTSRFSSDRSLYKIKVSPFHKWAPYICSTKSGSKIKQKSLF